jgi:hypothetical protein
VAKLNHVFSLQIEALTGDDPIDWGLMSVKPPRLSMLSEWIA